jgi:flagellar biosynthesis protein
VPDDAREPDQRPASPKAVALRYSAERDPAPRIVAAGQGAVAEQIVRIALDRGIPVRADADLVEILSALDVDSLIPVEAFAAVAEILAYVYRADGRRRPRQGP